MDTTLLFNAPEGEASGKALDSRALRPRPAQEWRLGAKRRHESWRLCTRGCADSPRGDAL